MLSLERESVEFGAFSFLRMFLAFVELDGGQTTWVLHLADVTNQDDIAKTAMPFMMMSAVPTILALAFA
eukprot:15366771-Ditylum_brightwellii.AAC.2